ncbi:methyltransferase domain-containing protein [Pseudomonas protegens]
MTDYRAEYDDYWSREDRVGESSGDVEIIANHIVNTCGLGSVLDLGSGEGLLVGALLRRGVDAKGLDVSTVVVERSNKRLPGRFQQGSILSLPFTDGAFHTIVSTDCMEHLEKTDVPQALQEIFRVAGRYVFLQLATTQDRDGHWHLTVEGRAWWESKCFEAGFRKHPNYYRLNEYEALNNDSWQIYILLEKIPAEALTDYTLESLDAERGLHMDMTRDTGERSDAHIIRYQWACNYIKPGDRVLDAACGLGYGGYIVRHLTEAASVVGIDGSDYAIDYATKSFSFNSDRAKYQSGMLPEALSQYQDGSFDVVISFETLEHVEKPTELLQEFYRVLTPGGRVIVSVPNDWSDETGTDPNPFHLHVYDWKRLKSELSNHFLLEDAYAQTASQVKLAGQDNVWERRSRSLRQVPLSEDSPVECEWWLMTAMKSPLGSTFPYEERVFANIADSGHPSIRYSAYFENPWLIYAMVNVSYRLKNPQTLATLAEQVLRTMDRKSNDYAAALCVKAYSIFEAHLMEVGAVAEVLAKIDQFTELSSKDLMGVRWKVSLLMIKGKLLQATGQMLEAKEAFIACTKIDIRKFGIHLATKVTEAHYLAGRISLAREQQEEARQYWQQGLLFGQVLLEASLEDVLIKKTAPNRFNNGDGIREYTVAWNNIAKCANGIYLLNLNHDIDYLSLENCHQTEYNNVNEQLIIVRQTLVERTRLLEQTKKEFSELDQDLINTRQLLIERTALLEQTSQDLLERTEDLVNTRQVLIDRTERLEKALKDLEQ